MNAKPDPPSSHVGQWVAIYPDGRQEAVRTSGRPIAVGDALPNGLILDRWDHGEAADGTWVVVGVLRDPRMHKIHLTDGTSKLLGEVSVDDAEAIADGELRIVGQLASYPETFAMIAEQMRAFGNSFFHELLAPARPSYAAMLGFEKAPEELGHYEQGWAAINDRRFPEDEDRA